MPCSAIRSDNSTGDDMNKRLVLWAVIGYLVAFLLPPQRLLAYFRGGQANG